MSKFLIVFLMPLLVHADEGIAQSAVEGQPGKCEKIVSRKAAKNVSIFEEYDAKMEASAEQEILSLRDHLAQIENKNPEGMSTYTKIESDARAGQVRQLLRMANERRAKMLVAETVVNQRILIRKLQEKDKEKARAVAIFRRTLFQDSAPILGLIRGIDDDRIILKQAIGQEIWMYSGLIGVMLEEAGLKPRPTLIADGIEQALQNDLSKAFVRAVHESAQLEAVAMSAVPPAKTPEENSKIIALRVLKSLRIVDDDEKEIRPTLKEVETLLAESGIVRVAKLKAELKYERHQQLIQKLLRNLSDQYLLGLVATGLNKLTVEKFKDFFEDTRKELIDKGANRKIHKGRILEFISIANLITDDAVGNEQLAKGLIRLMQTDPALLSSIAVDADCIEPLRRVKSSTFAKETIWGEKGKKFNEYIEELEGSRQDGLTSAMTGGSSRTHIIYPILAAMFIGYETFAHVDLSQFGDNWDMIKTVILGWIQ